MPNPRESTVPPTSRAVDLIEGASFYDAWSIVSNRVERSALEHFLVAAGRTACLGIVDVACYA